MDKGLLRMFFSQPREKFDPVQNKQFDEYVEKYKAAIKAVDNEFGLQHEARLSAGERGIVPQLMILPQPPTKLAPKQVLNEEKEKEMTDTTETDAPPLEETTTEEKDPCGCPKSACVGHGK